MHIHTRCLQGEPVEGLLLPQPLVSISSPNHSCFQSEPPGSADLAEPASGLPGSCSPGWPASVGCSPTGPVPVGGTLEGPASGQPVSCCFPGEGPAMGQSVGNSPSKTGACASACCHRRFSFEDNCSFPAANAASEPASPVHPSRGASRLSPAAVFATSAGNNGPRSVSGSGRRQVRRPDSQKAGACSPPDRSDVTFPCQLAGIAVYNPSF